MPKKNAERFGGPGSSKISRRRGERDKHHLHNRR
jgi:hypothetical protein